MENEYVVVMWPEIQSYMDKDSFDIYAFPILDERGLEMFGLSAYFVEKNWLNVQNSNLITNNK